MRLYVYVLEARDLQGTESKGNLYAKLQVGKYKSNTRVVSKALNPVWNEEFVFRVHDIDEELVVSIFNQRDDHGFFHASADLLGGVRVPVWSVVGEDKQTLPPTWFSLEKPKTGKFTTKDSGKILLTLSLHGENTKDSACPVEQSQDIVNSASPFQKKSEGKQLVKAIANRLERLFNKNEEGLTSDSRSEVCSNSDYEDCMDEPFPSCSFEEAIELMQSKDGEQEVLDNLQGGILLDRSYVVSPINLNTLLFAPNSQFQRDLAELQGTTDLQEGCWTWKSVKISCLTRTLTYTKAATKLVKAVKAIEEQTYLKAEGREFAVLTNVGTPDVPYGNCFKIELLYKIMPGPELSSGEESTHLVVSWNISFFQNTMMRSMIEGAARQGLRESFEQFADLLSQNLKEVNSAELLGKENMLATLQMDHKSDLELAIEFFCNFTVVSTIFMICYILLHILLSGPSKLQGLEFDGLDLPDTFGELITSGILVLQVERVFNEVSHFFQARLQRGSDHGVKGQGDGWVLTVALIEGNNLASVDSTGFSDPYVVFTCNGKSKTSSVKLQTRDPQWHEILEFDAMEDPPSVLDVEVFDFDGPFDPAASLGHAEINFLRHTSAELADMWVSLNGKLAQASQSRLHVRIFLENNKGVETIKEYLSKMEKEVGKKLILRSPYRNSMFQKLFGLPPEEFLIDDFSCYLKRKMLLQGRLFISARIVGFYANLFGHKTKFFFLWEDIEDIQEIPPSLASVGSPSLVIVLHKGRGMDARYGAKSQDDEGRLRFHFLSFGSFSVASRTIMALWRSRTLTTEQKGQRAEDWEDQDDRSILVEDDERFSGFEGATMSKVYSAEHPFNIKSLMRLFDGDTLEHSVMGKSGCLNYATTPWEAVKPEFYERDISYKFNRHVSIFGGEVTSTQQKFPIADGNGWMVDEIMTFHEVPFGDHFHVHLRYQIETRVLGTDSCHCEVYMGIAWLKGTKFRQRIGRNITEKFTRRLKEIFELVEREILLANAQDSLA
ncbi:C2 and GRAM domain-containing protein At5g50170 isoform X2 [Telopea speciosissima]|uniref:C2 and GRAM domain-containing protein At5g50170 isoform X2 n=1 Tax=Telopea speciosissima TaxID=54955 RepID=UPI001CC78C1C|nr:C2 and GRAM domain-containing protein At5g50170 isoform X2 [Telopea speciosissima]